MVLQEPRLESGSNLVRFVSDRMFERHGDSVTSNFINQARQRMLKRTNFLSGICQSVAIQMVVTRPGFVRQFIL